MSEWLRGNVLFVMVIQVILVSANSMWKIYFPLHLGTHLSTESIGYVFSLSLAFQMIGFIIGGFLADKLGRKRPIVYGLVIRILGLTLILIAPSILVAVLAYFIYTAGAGLSSPGLSMLIMESSPEKKRATAFMSATRIVPSIPPVVLSLIGGYLFDLGLYSYSVLVGVLCLAISIWISRAYLRETLKWEDTSSKPMKKSVLSVKSITNTIEQESYLLLLIFVFGLEALSSETVNWYLPLFLGNLGYKALSYGKLTSVSALVASIGAFIGGRLTDSIGAINTCSIGWLFKAGIFVILGSVSVSYNVLLVLYSMWMLFGILSAAAPPVMISIAYPQTTRASKMGILNFSKRFLSIVGPALASFTLSLKFNAPFLLSAILLITSTMTLQFARARKF